MREQFLHRAFHGRILQRILREQIKHIKNKLLTLLFVLLSADLALVALEGIIEYSGLPSDELGG